MTDADFDTALIAAFFNLAGNVGWRRATVAAAAREAGLSLARARERFPSRAAVLLRFGRQADQAALASATTEGTVRDRLFDLLMSRFEALQAHRSGVLALLQALPFEPPTAVLLACATKRSMRWMLQAAGVPATGLLGKLQVRGLLAVWLWGLRTWQRDETEDLATTMAAVDTALSRAEQAAGWLGGRPEAPEPREPEAFGEPEPPVPPSSPAEASSDPSAD
jgi:AcrR family transcriptional regulator